MNSKIMRKIIFLKSKDDHLNKKEIQKLLKFQENINKTVKEKLDLLCSHIIQKTELLSEDFMRENLKKQNPDKKPEEIKDEKKLLDFLISFIKEY